MASEAIRLFCVLVALVASFFLFRVFCSGYWSYVSSPESKKIKSGTPPKVLLISYDGFRWDYLSHATTPNIHWVIRNGVHATEGLVNTFITITAPNHYGMVTGLYEEDHGIISNGFFDPDLNETFNYFYTGNKTDPRFFSKGTPIWVVNDQSSKDRKTGCVMWVGCDVRIRNNNLPYRYISWNQTEGGNINWEDRVDKIVSWFSDPDDPINLGILYIEEPDETGHKYGPHDPRTLDVVKKVDQLTGYLLWSLQREGLLDSINIIMTADHGMADVPINGGLIDMSKLLNKDWYTNYGAGPNWNVDPKEGHSDDIVSALNDSDKLYVYRKPDIPKEYHYQNSARIMPIQLEAKLHHMFVTSSKFTNEHGKEINIDAIKDEVSIIGAHGYNNSYPEMHPYFAAMGPAFKKGFTVLQFRNLDLYPLMAHILGVTPAPNNGSMDIVGQLLVDPPDGVQREDSTTLKDGPVADTVFAEEGTLGMLAIVLVILLLALGRHLAVSRTRRQAPDDAKLLIA